MRVIEAAGTPREIGYAIGASAPDLVERAVELVCRLDLPEEEIERRLGPVERRLAEAFPAVLEEAEGLAEGAGIGRRDALVLSVASDLNGRLPGWCSLGAVPGAGGVLVGKNLDQSKEFAEVLVLERLAPEAGLAFLHLTIAGAAWTDGGINEAGLALVNASLAAAETDSRGVPDGILARELLSRCRDVASAIELAAEYGMMTLGENILVADAKGRTAVIEKLPGGQAVREGDTIVACNHPLVTTLEGLMAAGDPIRPNSERRCTALTDRVVGSGEWTVEEMGAVLADHEAGICQHGADELWTIASMVVAPRARRMWIADGPPCEAAYEEVNGAVGTEQERVAPRGRSARGAEGHRQGGSSASEVEGGRNA